MNMKKWIPLLVLSLAIGAGLAWIARPLEFSVRWGERPEQTARVSLNESIASAERTPEDQRAIESVESTSRAFVAIAKEVSPSIVTIYSERTIAVNRPSPGNGGNPFGGMVPDDFFRFFQMPDRVPQRGMGSGVIVSGDGRVLTNNHVVANADRVKVTLSDGRTFDATVLGRDPKSDVAVVKIDASDLPAATLGNSDALDVGEWVLAIGNPFELSRRSRRES
jgi:serine protease Do